MQAKAAPPKRFARRRAVSSNSTSFGWASQRVALLLFFNPPVSIGSRFLQLLALGANDSPSNPTFSNGLFPCCTNTRMLPAMRVVYVLRSAACPERYYVGLTSDVARRLDVHNSGGSRHTMRDRPWRLVASIEFSNATSAVAFEKYLKTGSGRAFAKRHLV